MLKKHKHFCLEYIKHFNGTKAYRAVYEKDKPLKYPRNTASLLLKRDDVREYLTNLVNEMFDEQIADVKEVMTYFTSVMRGEIELSDRERNKAAEILAKRYGILDERMHAMSTPVIKIDVPRDSHPEDE